MALFLCSLAAVHRRDAARPFLSVNCRPLTAFCFVPLTVPGGVGLGRGAESGCEGLATP